MPGRRPTAVDRELTLLPVGGPAGVGLWPVWPRRGRVAATRELQGAKAVVSLQCLGNRA
jgi:hypothetical protein